jgi:lipoprotein-anchoring transpeptidase ErfK/SrfK
MTPRARFCRLLPLLALLFGSCVAPDREHTVVISVPDQRMIVYKEKMWLAEFPVSTSKFGLGDQPGSRATPLGWLEIARKIGGGAASGAVFKNRERTGEIVEPDAPGRDPVVTRILWLRGLEDGNRLAYDRDIYIHGTPEEWRIGTAASFGCVRMRSRDIIALYDIVGVGARVQIVDAPLRQTPEVVTRTDTQ